MVYQTLTIVIRLCVLMLQLSVVLKAKIYQKIDLLGSVNLRLLFRTSTKLYLIMQRHCWSTIQGIFTCDSQLAEQHDRIHLISSGSNLPWTKDFQIYEKTKNVSLVASHKNYTEGHKLRHSLAKEHSDKLDIVGSINGERVGDSLFDKMDGYRDYRFTVVIENCNHDTYYTEKLTDAFATGTIPVYWGTHNVCDIFNPDGIIMLTDDFDFSQLTEELYQEKLDAVKDNFERVKNLKMADDELYEIIQTNR